jgi:cell wall-associated NlpC family hydrolase
MRLAALAALLLLGACTLKGGTAAPGGLRAGEPGAETLKVQREPPEIEDLKLIPQQLGPLAAAAGSRFSLDQGCRERLLAEFTSRYYAPWDNSKFDAREARDFIRQQGSATWYGVNKRVVPRELLEEIVANCALESFPSRNQAALAVAPAHLRGLPTNLPFYQSADDFPFDMLSYPQVKLNEPLRVLHASRDGVWLFVETAYSAGWIEKGQVAQVTAQQARSWQQAPKLVVVRDYAPVPDGRGVAVHQAKVGTLLPLLRLDSGGWQVQVASAGEGGRAEMHQVTLPSGYAAPFPLSFDAVGIALVGDQFLGDAYGWGEVYDLRDCSALLRDFFLPFGIWLPRTSADQVASVPGARDLHALDPGQKLMALTQDGVPFLTLLYKPGHIMLYVGQDSVGRPLVLHDAWSIRLRAQRATHETAGRAAATRIIGLTAITTLEPGKELGLEPGSSLLERLSELAVIKNRCP